jgi:hypothetical protein
MPVAGVTRFERFFRAAARLDVDKDDLKRYSDFVNQQICNLLLIGQATAKANVRDVIEPWDLPITKELHESIHRFREINQETGLEPIPAYLAAQPPLMTLEVETQARLPLIAGGLSVALGRAIKIIYPERKHATTQEWERAFQIFDLLL